MKKLLLAFLLLTACTDQRPEPAVSPAPPPSRFETERPAPSSSLTKLKALELGEAWVGKHKDRGFSVVQPTGSMAPVFDSRTILLLERVAPVDTQLGDLLVYERADGLMVGHRLVLKDGRGLVLSGDSNRRSDGWVSPDQVRWRIAGLIFTEREPKK